jgi:hypothetical protein
MKKMLQIILVATIIIFPVKIFSQNYNVNTVETLKGQITRIDKMSSGKNSSGIHLVLKTDKDSIAVHVGPEWYLTKQNVQLNVNDNIEVKGSQITYNNKPAIIAAEIKKGNSTLTLRDSKGFPLWSGRNK